MQVKNKKIEIDFDNEIKNLPKERLVWVDWTKAILIAFVCVGHFYPPVAQMKLIYGIHMPAFFIISGYLYHRHNGWRTLWSFVIPIVFFSFINLLLYIVEGLLQVGSYNLSHFYYRFIEQFFFSNPTNIYTQVPLFIGIWFVVALLGVRMFAGDIKAFSFTLRYKYITLAVLLLLISMVPIFFENNPLKYLKIYNTVYAFPFFVVGYIMHERQFDLHNINKWLIVLMAAIYVIITLNQPRFNMSVQQFGICYLSFFMNALLGSIVLFWLCTWFKSSSIIKTLSVGTLLILVMHMNIHFITLPVLHRLGITPTLSQSIVPWICMIIVMVVCYYPIKWLWKYCPILLGKMPVKTF